MMKNGTYGGGVLVSTYQGTSRVTMNGGEISGNKAEYGAGIFLENSKCKFDFQGGKITPAFNSEVQRPASPSRCG